MADINLRREPTAINFPIVGIGASAGGLDAFKKFVQSIPLNSGMAYVLVQHLAPGHESLLPEILSRDTEVAVHLITDDIDLVPDTIYIIPENKILTAYDGKLKLEPRDESNKVPRPIDIFFNSLAEVHKGFARGIILSGTGFDGTTGLMTIKEYGGSTFVQNPDTAAFDGMPLSAIRAGAADFVLEPEEMPAKLQNIDTAYQCNNAYNNGETESQNANDQNFAEIIKIIRERTGHDFSHYKKPTIRRRVARRMVISKMFSADGYLQLLQSDMNEQDSLFNDILIPVSYFFRDTTIFSSVKDTILPHIVEKKAPEDSIRIWVAGCSTGEEAYSVAISLHEYLSDKMPNIKVQIFASDISETVINKARTGSYGRQEVQNVSEARLNKYFTKIDGGYTVKKVIRDMCVFAVHNFVKDPPFAKMDLITCRNVLIYLDPFLQKKALSIFHYALRPQGILFLGKSETAGTAPKLFEPLIKNQKVFIRKNTTDKYLGAGSERRGRVSYENIHAQPKKAPAEPDFYKLGKNILFSDYTPAAVIIDGNNEILHFHADTEPFLMQQPGKPNFNIYKMVREGIAFELRTAIVEAKNTGKRVKKENVAIKGKEYHVNFEVVPLGGVSEDIYYLILFQQENAGYLQMVITGKPITTESERIKQLEAEIEQMREDIKKVTEDQEVANEELQSANEELLSNSEELQTLNEELETSAEELQSNNEELITVNEELKDRQAQLSVSRLYSEAIIKTIREPLLVLNGALRVRSANEAFYKIFVTNDNDLEGRLIFDIVKAAGNTSAFKEQLYKILPEKLKLDNLEVNIIIPDRGERTFLVNVRPIITDSLGEHLILVAFEDISDIRAANIMLLQTNRELEENNKELSTFSYIASHDLQEPLRKIYTFSKLIEEDETTVLSESSITYLSRTRVSISRMQKLIDDLLHYSHVGKVDDELEVANVNHIIEDVINELSETIKFKNASIEVAALPSLTVIPTLIYQLFNNIICNSLKYSRQEVRPLITISHSIPDETEMMQLGGKTSAQYSKITVQDNGIGFPQSEAEIIFEPFKRLHNKDKYEGTGIGLAICKKIMLQHRGFITVTSIPGDGTAFHVYFPI